MRTRSARGLAPIFGIGGSAGGVEALTELLGGLGPDLAAPVFVSQHLPGYRVGVDLVDLLSPHCALPIVAIEEGCRPRNGRVYVVGSRHDLGVRERPPFVEIYPQAGGDGPCPNVDVMLMELARWFGARVHAVVLSGMGDDGLMGSRVVQAAGGSVWVQDRASSTVWGMPGRVAQAGIADLQGSPKRLARAMRNAAADECTDAAA